MAIERPIERPRQGPPLALGDPALESIHKTLIDYGLCWIRGGGSDRESMSPQIIEREPDLEFREKRSKTKDPEKYRIVMTSYRESDPNEEPQNWTMPEIEAFGRLHNRINKLPLKAQSLTIQVFYAETWAEDWPKIPPPERLKILRDLTHWPIHPYGVNKRLARAQIDSNRILQPIRHTDFMRIMLSGIRMLADGRV